MRKKSTPPWAARAFATVLACLVVASCETKRPDEPGEPASAETTSTVPSSVESGGGPGDESARYAAAIVTLEKAIDERYSYRDRLGLDWNELFAQATPELTRAATRDAFVESLVRLLANAKDPHITVVVDGKPLATDPTKIEWNFAVAQIKKRVTDWKFPGKCLSVGRVDGFAYVLVNDLQKGRCDSLPRDWADAYPDVSKAPGMIMDLRGNSGGNEVFAQQIAGYFVEAAVPYVKAEIRDDKAPGGFRAHEVRTLEPAKGALRYDKPVVVLSGPVIMSSAESFLLMMRAAGGTIVGGKSRGSSGFPQSVELGHGISVNLPSWRAMLVDGTQLEGVGVAPDVEVVVTPEEVASSDKVIDAGVAELKRRLAAKR